MGGGIAGVAAGGGELGPAGLAAGPGFGALPGGAGEVGEGVEGLEVLAGGIDLAGAVGPGGWAGWFRGWGSVVAGGFDEAEGGVDFGGGRFALEEGVVEVTDAVAGWEGGGGVGEGLGAGGGEGSVEEEEGLLGDGGFVADGHVDVGVGEVEGAEHAGEELAVDGGVEGAAEVGGGEQFGGWAAWGAVQFAGGGEHGVAELFEVEAAEGIGAGLLVGGAGEDEAVDGFDAPAFGDEAEGEPVEESGVGRGIGAEAEVAGGGDEAAAEVVVPDAVDHDPGGEGVGGVDDGAGQFEAAAALVERLAVVVAGEDLEEPAGDGVAEASRAAADEHARVRFGGAIGEDEGGGGAEFEQAAVDVALQFPQFLGDRGGEERLGVDDAGVGDAGGGVGVIEEGAEFGGALEGGFLEGLEEGQAVEAGDFADGGGGGGEGLGDERVEGWVAAEVVERGGGLVGEGARVEVGEGREGVPGAEDGVGGVSVGEQEVAPAADRGGDQVVVAEDLVEALLGVLVEFQLGGEVIRDACLESGVGFGAAFGVGLAEGGAAFGQFRVVEGGEGDQLDIGGVEDAVEGVVILDGDGVVFVVVAAGALDGEAEGAAGDDVDAVVDDVMGDPEEAAAAGDEAHGGEVGGIRGCDLVGGDLEEEELVVGEVLVEGADDPVAVGVSVDEAALLAGVDVAFGVGVAGDIEPVAAPAFAVVGAVEEAIDEAFDGGGVEGIAGGGVGEGFAGEGLDLVEGRREAGEGGVGAADEGSGVGGREGLAALGFELGEDEAVEVVDRPAGVLDGRRWGGLRGLEGPVEVGIGWGLEGGPGGRGGDEGEQGEGGEEGGPGEDGGPPWGWGGGDGWFRGGVGEA